MIGRNGLAPERVRWIKVKSRSRARSRATNGLALKYASDELKRDRTLVLEAVKQNGNALEAASYDLQGDKEIVQQAVRNTDLH